MRGRDLDSFRKSDKYQSWACSEHPCLLILSGHNDPSIRYDTDQCWLSPVAIAAVKDFRQQKNRPIHVYYLFPRKVKLLYDALPVILLQLLRQKRHSLRDDEQHDELCSELRKFHEVMNQSIGEHGEYKIAAIEKVALRIIDFFEQSEVVYITIDRIDRCKDPHKGNHRKAFLQALVKMVEAARCKLRILAVIDGHSWPWHVQDHRDELGEKTEGRLIIHTAQQGEGSS